MKKSICITVAVLYCALVQAKSAEVSSTQMMGAWPLTVDTGVLRCDSQLVTFIANGKTYALNGSAKTKAPAMLWLDVRQIWKDDPANPGAKISIAPLISKGLDLCK